MRICLLWRFNFLCFLFFRQWHWKFWFSILLLFLRQRKWCFSCIILILWGISVSCLNLWQIQPPMLAEFNFLNLSWLGWFVLGYSMRWDWLHPSASTSLCNQHSLGRLLLLLCFNALNTENFACRGTNNHVAVALSKKTLLKFWFLRTLFLWDLETIQIVLANYLTRGDRVVSY